MAELRVSAVANPLDPYSVTFEEREKQIRHEEMMMEEKKKSSCNDFAQLNRKNITHIISACAADKQAVRLLLFIIEHMDKFNALVCSYQVFQEQLGISQPTVARAIKYLKEHGFIAIYRSGMSNVYVLNDDLAWTNHGDKHKYCKFPANIMLSASEQPKKKTPYMNTKVMGDLSDLKGDEE